MRPVYWTIFLLLLSNVFMTFAWYAHLRELSTKPWFIAALVSWGIALFEYLLQVPANRIGYQEAELGPAQNFARSADLDSLCTVCRVLHEQSRSSSITCGPACACWARCTFIFRGE